MNRRDTVLALIALGAVSGPLASLAQQQGKVRRIGFLDPRSRPTPSNPDPGLDAFVRRMRDLGYIEGGNLAIEWRFADDKYERLPSLAAELVRTEMEVIVVRGTPAALALQKATSKIPIVVTPGADLVGQGLAASLARPGGNITGLSNIASDTGAKQLELLKSTIPTLSRVAVLVNPGNPTHSLILKNIQIAGGRMGVITLPVSARTPLEIHQGFATMSKEHTQAIIVAADGFLIAHRSEIAELALKKRLPLMFPYSEAVLVGGLMSYGPSLTGFFRQAAIYVDRILKGAKPSELPIEQPSQLELAINLKTARTLGLVIPKELLFRADLVVE